MRHDRADGASGGMTTASSAYRPAMIDGPGVVGNSPFDRADMEGRLGIPLPPRRRSPITAGRWRWKRAIAWCPVERPAWPRPDQRRATLNGPTAGRAASVTRGARAECVVRPVVPDPFAGCGPSTACRIRCKPTQRMPKMSCWMRSALPWSSAGCCRDRLPARRRRCCADAYRRASALRSRRQRNRLLRTRSAWIAVAASGRVSRRREIVPRSRAVGSRLPCVGGGDEPQPWHLERGGRRAGAPRISSVPSVGARGKSADPARRTTWRRWRSCIRASTPSRHTLRRAMGRMANAYPDDANAQLFHSLALMEQRGVRDVPVYLRRAHCRRHLRAIRGIRRRATGSIPWMIPNTPPRRWCRRAPCRASHRKRSMTSHLHGAGHVEGVPPTNQRCALAMPRANAITVRQQSTATIWSGWVRLLPAGPPSRCRALLQAAGNRSSRRSHGPGPCRATCRHARRPWSVRG